MIWISTPWIRMFEWKCQTIIDGSDLDFRQLYQIPFIFDEILHGIINWWRRWSNYIIVWMNTDWKLIERYSDLLKNRRKFQISSAKLKFFQSIRFGYLNETEWAKAKREKIIRRNEYTKRVRKKELKNIESKNKTNLSSVRKNDHSTYFICILMICSVSKCVSVLLCVFVQSFDFFTIYVLKLPLHYFLGGKMHYNGELCILTLAEHRLIAAKCTHFQSWINKSCFRCK